MTTVKDDFRRAEALCNTLIRHLKEPYASISHEKTINEVHAIRRRVHVALEKMDLAEDQVAGELLSALVLIDYAIPPLWGDKCVDGVVNIDLSSDVIEAVQSAIKFAKGKIK